jgi:nitrogen fixation protein NifU and related proteins
VTDPLYQALIVEHDRSPRHHGPLPGATHEATIDNPLCGDVVTIRLVVDGGRVTDARFEGRGCALSRAAASMLTTQAAGRRVDELRALATTFDQLVAGDPDAPVPPGLGELGAFAGVRRARARRGCATLSFPDLVAALSR